MLESLTQRSRRAISVAAFILVFIGGFVTGTLSPFASSSASREYATDVTAIYALKVIGQDLDRYAQRHEGHLPATLDFSHADATIPRDPFSGGEFRYVGGSLIWDTSKTEYAELVACTTNRRLDRHQYALFTDGAVLRLSDADLDQRLRQVSTSHPQP